MKRSKLSKNIMKKYKKKILIAFLAILALGITFGIVDFNRVAVKHKKPLFAIGTNLKKDGGSGVYIGLGYAYARNVESGCYRLWFLCARNKSMKELYL